MKSKLGQRIDPILIGILLLAAFLNLYGIWNDTSANAYYTAAVTSMLTSFHNFFFASFEPGGYVTVDKPPVAFWIQTLFAYVFGVHGWSVILPQALAGVGSVLFIYLLVKPSFGKTAARLASLIMACTPIAVAVSRTNNIDSLLVFTLLLATWMLFTGIRKQQMRWIFAAFAVIGIAFNMKMLQAYMVVPAFFLIFLLAFKAGWKKKLSFLSMATALMVMISLSWAVIVDAIPADQRPYIGSSQTNSVLELAFGYNGLSRLNGNGGPSGGNGGSPPGQQVKNDTSNSPQMQQNENNASTLQQGGNTPPQMQQNDNGNQSNGNGPSGGPQGQGGGSFGTGQAGPLRLFQTELSGQASWLLPFVLIASIGLLANVFRRKPIATKQRQVLFWLAWLLPIAVFFSIAGFFHHYYLIMLAPAIAVLSGAGFVELWKQYRRQVDWKKWLLPLAILATTAFELYVLYPFQEQIGIWWSIGIGVVGLGLTLALLFATHKATWTAYVAKACMLVLLVAPMYWAATPIVYGGNSMLPQAGPTQSMRGPSNNKMPMGNGPQMQQGNQNQQEDGTQSQNTNKRENRPNRMMPGGSSSQINTKLLEYVTKHNTGEIYLFATTSSNSAAPYIIKTGKPVMAMGGFSGSDPILTVKKLQQMVKNKQVKYFLIPSSSDRGGMGMGNSDVMKWIRENSTEVPKAQWQENNSQGSQDGPMGPDGQMTLYQIKN